MAKSFGKQSRIIVRPGITATMNSDANLFHSLARTARERPEHVAMIEADVPVTYGELLRRTEALAGALQKSGVEAG